MSTRHCPIEGCAVPTPRNLLMCRAHWAMCNAKLRSEVWRWYRNGQEHGNPPPTEMYRAAAKAAIDQVNELEAVHQDQAKQKMLL